MPPYGVGVAMLGAEPVWLSYFVVIAGAVITVCLFGVAFGKMGRSPFWGFVFLVPYLGTIMLWVFGYGSWPQAAVDIEPDSGL